MNLPAPGYFHEHATISLPKRALCVLLLHKPLQTPPAGLFRVTPNTPAVQAAAPGFWDQIQHNLQPFRGGISKDDVQAALAASRQRRRADGGFQV